MGTLYVVDVPLGSPEDVTLRALRVLHEVSLVLAPDISRAQEFLARNGIDTPLAGCTGNAEQMAGTESVLQALERGDVALLAEMENPAFAAPLHRLVRTAVERGVPVASVPGPSAAVTALVLSGLPADAFVCLGSLPERAAERRTWLALLVAERRTMVGFAPSHALLAVLGDVAETLGDRPVALVQVGVEYSEGMWRGTVREALAYLETNLPRGECVLVIGGATEGERRWSEAQVRSELARLLAEGLSRKTAARQVAEVSGWRRREVYRLAVGSDFAFGPS